MQCLLHKFIKMGDERMTRIDMSKEFTRLNETQQHFVKKLEGLNKTRADKTITSMKRNRVTGALLGLGVLGIYFYTIKAVKQEKFLDDFDEIPPSQGKSI